MSKKCLPHQKAAALFTLFAEVYTSFHFQMAALIDSQLIEIEEIDFHGSDSSATTDTHRSIGVERKKLALLSVLCALCFHQYLSSPLAFQKNCPISPMPTQ